MKKRRTYNHTNRVYEYQKLYQLNKTVYFDEDGDICDTSEEALENGETYSCLRKQYCFLQKYNELKENLKPQADDYLELYSKHDGKDKQFYIDNYVFMVNQAKTKIMWLVEEKNRIIKNMEKLESFSNDIKYVDLFSLVVPKSYRYGGGTLKEWKVKNKGKDNKDENSN